MRLGTANSRAPSGVGAQSSGVSTSQKPCRSMAPAQRRVHRGPQAEVGLHPRPPQVDEAVAHADELVGVGVVLDRERRRLGLGQDLDGAVPDLDLAGGQAFGFTVPSGRAPHRARHRDHVLAAHVDGTVEHALDDPAVVAQVDEGQVLAVLAPARHPAAQPDDVDRRRRA